MGKPLIDNTSTELYEASLEQDPSLEVTSPPTQIPSYHPTGWPIVNRSLDLVDSLTGGLAGWVQRFISYAFIGGCAAIVNLIVFYIVYYRIPLPVSSVAHNIIAFLFAAEISILANFIPNDYFTFRHLPGHSRSWGARCVRFHITTFSGTGLTFLIEFALTNLTHITPFFAEAIALIIVLFYNFTIHHVFTYRHVKHA